MGLARGHGVGWFAFGGGYWPLAIAHSDPLWVQTCFGCVCVCVCVWEGRGGGGTPRPTDLKFRRQPFCQAHTCSHPATNSCHTALHKGHSKPFWKVIKRGKTAALAAVHSPMRGQRHIPMKRQWHYAQAVCTGYTCKICAERAKENLTQSLGPSPHPPPSKAPVLSCEVELCCSLPLLSPFERQGDT